MTLRIDKHKDVLTTFTHVQFAFEQLVRESISGINCVFSDSLDLEKALRLHRSNNSYDGNSESPFPMLIYTREPMLTPKDGIAGRLKSHKARASIDEDTVMVLNATQTEVDVNFMFVSPDIKLLEQFEVAYNGEEIFSNIKEIIVSINPLGDFSYFTRFTDLTQIDLFSEGVEYKGIIGTMTVRGNYFTFERNQGIIREINANIYASRVLNEKTELLGNINIVGADNG